MRRNGQKSTNAREVRRERLKEPKNIPVRQMKEDLGRIPEWFSYIREATGVAHDPGPGYNPNQARTANLTDFHQAEGMIEGAIWRIVLDMPRLLIEAGVEYYRASLPPLLDDKGRIFFRKFFLEEEN